MKAHIQWSPWTGLYHATLLGGEFDNCHGQGPTPDQAMISLKLTVRAKRRLVQYALAPVYPSK
jgi:hypothetical protein